MRAPTPLLLCLLVLCCALAVAAEAASSDAGQGGERSRRAAVGMPLPPDVHEAQAARTRALLTRRENAPSPTLQLQGPEDWRLRIREAAVAAGDMVLLGEIAEPLGAPPEIWRKLSAQPLWPSPPEPGKPLQINKVRLSQALRDVLGAATANRCLVPTALVVQRGGMVLREDDLRSYVVKSLAPQLASLPGRAELNEFRLPSHIFLEHGRQQVELETGRIAPGRITLRFVVREMDGAVLRRVAGTAFLDMWLEVPAAARPLNKGDALGPDDVTFIRMNAAHFKGMPWDGRGGPWQVMRGVGTGQPLFQADLAPQAMARKGSIVQVVYARGNLHMTAQAECLADGEPGAAIPVRNLQSKRQIFAVVRDNKTVTAQ